MEKHTKNTTAYRRIRGLLFAGIIFGISTTWLTGCKAASRGPISRSSFLLNTFVTVTLYSGGDEEVLDGAMDLCAWYEGLLSKTIETSEVYQMNHRKPGEREFTVSEETAEVLKKGLYYSALSEGVFDITIEPLSSLWDFTAEDPVVPSEEEIQEALPRVGYENVSVSGNQVVFANDETTIDLGAIAKGYIADRIKDYLKEEKVESAVINLGGNVLCLGERPDGTPFQIGLQKPFASHTETVGVAGVRDLSVVSSGVYERHFIKDGVNYHHILDPSTGYPYENGLVQVTILSPQSVDGDGLSTTAFALGLEKGTELLESMEDVYGIFITEDGELHFTEGAEDFILAQ